MIGALAVAAATATATATLIITDPYRCQTEQPPSQPTTNTPKQGAKLSSHRSPPVAARRVDSRSKASDEPEQRETGSKKSTVGVCRVSEQEHASPSFM